jgi:putative flippase GtrA
MSPPLRQYASELFRFGLVGSVAAILQLGAFSLFYNMLHVDHLVSATIAYVITIIAHFFLNRTFTFSVTQRISGTQIKRYAMLLALNYVVIMGCVWSSTDLFRLAPQMGIVFALLVTALISFLVMKHFVFGPVPASLRG